MKVGCLGTATERGQALRTAVEGAAPSTIVELGSCTYELDPRPAGTSGIWIDRDSLTIRGTGSDSRILLRPTVALGLEIQSGAQHITIRDLLIEGPVTATRPDGVAAMEPSQAVGSYSGQSRIQNITITGIEVKNVTVGISIGSPQDGACVPGRYVQAEVVGNYVHDVHGLVQGSGYAIHVECAERAIIRGNVVARAERHSIYQARTVQVGDGRPDDVVILDNTIIDHSPVWRCDGTRRVAIAIARSNNVTVIGNLIVSPYQEAISVEWDPARTNANSENVYLIGNHVIRPPDEADGSKCGQDLWINVPDTRVTLWHNAESESLRQAAHAAGSPASVEVTAGTAVEPPEWRDGTEAIVERNGVLLVKYRGGLQTVTPRYGIDPAAWPASPLPIWLGTSTTLPITEQDASETVFGRSGAAGHPAPGDAHSQTFCADPTPGSKATEFHKAYVTRHGILCEVGASQILFSWSR
jgi:hypothetical protein